MATILDGKGQAAAVRQGLAARVADYVRQTGQAPGLVVILVGDDPASQVYVRNKERAAREVGMEGQVIRLPADAEQAEVLEIIRRLDEDASVHGILVQSPVPRQLDFETLVAAISPEKDVDGFHPINLGRLARGLAARQACTPRAVMEILRQAAIDLKGKHAVVVGRSTIVGKPLALMLLAANATVTVCHRHTKDLAHHTRQADVLVVATGVPGLVTGEMVKPGAAVIDVGMNRVGDRLVGDVDFESARRVAGCITPVPGGVGPMTIAMLLTNTLEAAEEGARRVSTGLAPRP